MKTNLPQHQCANKCTNFKEEQCGHCLISESGFIAGDTVVFIDAFKPGHLMTVHKVQGKGVLLDGNRNFALSHLIRHADVREIQAGERHITSFDEAFGDQA